MLPPAYSRVGWIQRQIGRKINFIIARQLETTSTPKDMERVYRWLSVGLR
jgi:hypothetical protein